jgi:predicted cupin superfamily sugar epimerase
VRELSQRAMKQACGFLRASDDSEERAAREQRSFGVAVCFLMTPRAIDQAHRIHIDQLYRCYRGDRLELQVLKRDSSRDKVLSIEICDTRARAVLHPRQHPPHGARDRAAAPIRDRQSRQCRVRRGRTVG